MVVNIHTITLGLLAVEQHILENTHADTLVLISSEVLFLLIKRAVGGRRLVSVCPKWFLRWLNPFCTEAALIMLTR